MEPGEPKGTEGTMGNRGGTRGTKATKGTRGTIWEPRELEEPLQCYLNEIHDLCPLT